jgi:predicted TIM-barrel fold metal-dependent hydrolase
MPNFSLDVGAIDAWINPNFGPMADSSRDVSYLFPALKERLEKPTSLSQLVDEMDSASVAKAVLCSGYSSDEDLEWVLTAINKYPERFVGSHVVDPRKGMEAVRLVERLVADHDYRLIRVLGFETQVPYNHPSCYPVYAKCIELGIPVGLNVGIPGPLVPGRHQDPLALDDVCAFFPELTVIMQHGGEPWVDLCVKLMLKWKNLHYMTSAFAPKHVPPAIIHYANTRGSEKVMFASDFPLLSPERCMREAVGMPFRDQEHFDKFIALNARTMFFDRR